MTSAWFVVPCLDEARDQMNDRFPHRSKASDGSIGDQLHRQASGGSSHNPDESGNPEYNDHDGKNEVRARDFDKNLNDPDVTMEDVIQLWVKLARQGTIWWARYLIYNGRIWHKRDGFKTHSYNGASQHKEHAHVNSDFTQQADTVRGTNWHLANLKKGSSGSTPSNPPSLDVDGRLGPKTISRWQQVMHTPIDGKIDPQNSALIKAVQGRLKTTVDHNLLIDGQMGHHTIAALQKYLRTPVDGFISTPVSQVVKALQRRLNSGSF